LLAYLRFSLRKLPPVGELYRKPISVAYASANGTATPGADYYAVSGTLIFNPGVTSQTITVFAIGDTLVEGNETLLINPHYVTPTTFKGYKLLYVPEREPLAANTLRLGETMVEED